MMNVKDRYSGINMRDECRQPWTKNCTSFKKLNETCDIISSCAWSGGRGRTQKFTNQTEEAFVLSTRANIEAAELLLTQHNFIYVLPGVFADEALEKFFGQARQRSGAGYLEHKYRANILRIETENDDDHRINSEFLTNLNRGGLTVPLLSTVGLHFVHSAYKLFGKCNLHCCRAHLSHALRRIDSPMVVIQGACLTLSNILLKAFVLDNSDKERQLGCFRRKEKLSTKN
ncbi:uncharacterized protein LOC143469759 [Clavelina lepadiformis]|uniref:uncharacterized protein LOC143469759 n=1 Tax=Clavelina lepadiformis TaxID=159417 RepID=UPI0040430FCF